MHAQRADEVAFHQPEGLGEQQRAGDFGSHAIDHFPPELLRHVPVKLRLAHAVLGARRDGTAGAGTRKPEPVKMPLGQCHGRVKADHRKQTRHMQNGLNHLLAHRWIQVIELRSVVPGKAGAVVAVIDEARLARVPVAPLEDHCGVCLLEVVVVNLDLHAAIVGEIGTIEAVCGIGRILP